MREMKDSGIGWIKEIPENWNASKIGTLYELRNTKVNDKDYKPLSVTMNGIVPQLETAAKTNAHDDRKLVCEGDFVINSRSDRRGSCGISSYDGSVSLINIVLRPFTNMNPVYYNWLFHTVNFADEFFKWGHGIVDDLWTTGWQEMKNIIIPTPPIDEQKRIATYLDEQCKKIDEIMADIQNQIDTLEDYKKTVISEAVTKGLDPDVTMKDSGIAWIGVIPEHWKTIKGKYLFTNDKKVVGAKVDDYERLALTMKGVIKRSKDDNEGLQPDKFNTYQILGIDELVFKLIDLQNISTSRVGLSSYTGIVSPAYIIIKSNGNVLPCYAEKFYLSLWMNQIFNFLGDAGVRSSLNAGELLNLYLPVPPISEQRAIAEFLDGKCSEIDAIITGKQQQLENLKAYKQSIIYEYVTGKKEVPENE